VSPYLGYHYFTGERDIDDNPEYGLRLGKSLNEKFEVELGVGYIPTEYDNGNDTNLFQYLGHVKYYFLENETLKPYGALGIAGDLSSSMNIGPSAALGVKYMIKDNFGVFAEVRYNYLFGDGNDVIAALGLTFNFGKKSKPVMDSDNDGVNDNIDKCLDTPKGDKVDSTGCTIKPVVLDTDKDGVADTEDMCQNTPMNTPVDKKGCPLDTDNDGVFDYLDKCPNTQANVKVDLNGCPLDSDMDGVFDGLDKCPNSVKNAIVDKDGCEVKITLNVQFDTNKSDIKPEYVDEIKKFAEFLKRHPEVKVEIAGHTDSDGDRDKNIALSQKRADAVAEYLSTEFGIEKDRITAKGYGPDKPVASNDTEEGKNQNRRVEALLLK
jgi:OOP family OmpA-OmpF porin